MGESLHPRNLRHLRVSELHTRLESLPAVDLALLRALARDSRRSVRTLAARLRARQARIAREAARLEALFTVEREHRALGHTIIAGVDEAGVAPLAGPVVAAAVVLPPEARLPRLNDSKQVTAEIRAILYEEITRVAIAVSIGQASVEEIDQLNVLQATRRAHKRAIEGLPLRPHLVLIDGRFAAEAPVVQLAIIDGDATCASIAAASIVAKVTRDRLMDQLAARYPGYGFMRNKGYGTRAHLDAIRRLGITPVHRRSFFPVKGWQEKLPIGLPRRATAQGRPE